MEKKQTRNRNEPQTGNVPGQEKKHGHNWDMLYPEEKDRYPRYRVMRIKKTKDDLRELNKLLKRINRHKPKYAMKKKKQEEKKLTQQGHLAGGGRTVTTKLTAEQRQRCMVKMYYGDSKESHLKHLKEYMTQMKKNGVTEKPVLFGNISMEEYAKKATDRYFKWIISPEKKMSRDELENLARTYMDKMERKTGRKYDWQAAIHLDTEHPHIHIVINGNDLEGKPIKKFDPEYVKNWARKDAQEILTTMLGPRTPDEIESSKEKALDADRLTELDETIESLDMNAAERDRQRKTRLKAEKEKNAAWNAIKEEVQKKYQKQLDEIHEKYGYDPRDDLSTYEKNNCMTEVRKHQKPIWEKIYEETEMKMKEIPEIPVSPEAHLPIAIHNDSLAARPDIRRRLEHLKELDIAKYKDGKYILEDDWQDTLKNLGRYNMYLNAKEHVSKDCKLNLYDHQSEPIRGKLSWIYYMDDENVWTNALVIESEKEKTAWYIPVYDLKLLKGREGAEDIKPGQEVVLKNIRKGTGKLMPRIYLAKEWDKHTYKHMYKKENVYDQEGTRT